jgi:glutamine cyclotransferase
MSLRRRIVVGVLVMATPWALGWAVTPTCSYRVIAHYPHDPTAFTQGLEIADGELYEGTGLWGESSIRRVDLETGTVLQLRENSDEYFGEGITIWHDSLYQLTYQARLGFIYDLHSFDPTGQVTYTTEGWGLCHDAERLIMSDGSAMLTFRDPDTFAALGQVEVHDDTGPIHRLNELEYIAGEVWANVFLSDRIVRIDPGSGEVIAWVNLSGLLEPYIPGDPPGVLNGIAWDAWSHRLYVTGKRWPLLFEIEVTECPPLPAVFADSFESGDLTGWLALPPRVRPGARRVEPPRP